ncbi:hypothetical protein [Mitsuaria sp. GD03876]|uniref:hypothetical protein n=1 Tax=Mitsuaria sp. GD03876 TaxID=2975399 RepID=UPI00244CCA65|nr:hypothetical protein [Mitsuaria sp. GD03876]MDH0864094.1 hypothetical protein [Mitsuaria sp. GD03876]
MTFKKLLLATSKFCIEVVVDVPLSIFYTKKYIHHGADFLFAAVELWLIIGQRRELIASSANPGNFLEDLKDIVKQVESPPSVPGLDAIITHGGWAEWMVSYWDRVQADLTLPEDENFYERVAGLSAMDSKDGYLAIYRYGDSPIIEVSTRSDQLSEQLKAYDEFSPKSLLANLNQVRDDIVQIISDGMRNE